MAFAAFLAGMALVLALVALRSRASFAAQAPGDYAGKGPAFDLKRHLNGPLICEGMVFGPLGRVGSRFVAEMEGSWDGDRGTLRERFRYDTGRVQTREWRLALDGMGVRAEADDVPGGGTGRVEGPTVMLRYRIRLDPQAGGHVLDVTDWMYLLDNGTILNRSQFRKFGVMVAELQAVIRPRPETMAQGMEAAA